ncbi:MAG: TOBE domain-containing protein [Xanthobacteraceae bacterium]|nr:TOBE domain-containing protein [Xanthobacteraceae bacterium]
MTGRISFAAYLGNTLRYDIELAPGVIFKVDIRDVWHHERLATGTEVAISFLPSSTVPVAVIQ